MKTVAIILALAATMVAAIPASDSTKLVAREPDCQACIDNYDFCVANGHTEGQKGCMQTCAEHVCWFMRECKGCGDEFDACAESPDKSRFAQGRGPRGE